MPGRNWKIVAGEVLKGSYDQLNDVAAELGVEYRGGHQLDLQLNGAPVTFALSIDSGSVVGVIIRVGLEGPVHATGIKVTLRPELPSDREGKELGINREVQTGDERFDDAVYIDSNASDAETQRVLAKPVVRNAITELLGDGCQTIEIHPHKVEGKFAKTGSIFNASTLIAALERLLVVGSAGGPRARGTGANGQWLYALCLLAGFASVPFAFITLRGWDYSWWLVLIGASLGLALASSLKPLLRRLMSGDSGSYARYRFSSFTLSLACLLSIPSLAVWLNATLDRSAPVVLHGEVTSASYDDEEGRTSVDIQWADGSSQSKSLGGTVGSGMKVTKREARGFFGFRWSTRPRLGSGE